MGARPRASALTGGLDGIVIAATRLRTWSVWERGTTEIRRRTARALL